MVFSWLRNLERGLIRGTARRNFMSPRQRKAASVSTHATAIIVESLESRQMLSANPIPTLIQTVMINPAGTVGTNQYVQITGTPNAVLASGTYLVGVSGTAATAGQVEDVFTLSGDTSAATALASRMAARLFARYPGIWPETVRALLVHFAEWTPEMLGGRDPWNLTGDELRELLRTVGYGAPRRIISS